MRDMESVRDIMQELADAIIRKTIPFNDDISESQARELYGDKWLRRMKRSGLAEYNRVGNRNVFSRHQLNCLRQAEREHAKLVFARINK